MPLPEQGLEHRTDRIRSATRTTGEDDHLQRTPPRRSRDELRPGRADDGECGEPEDHGRREPRRAPDSDDEREERNRTDDHEGGERREPVPDTSRWPADGDGRSAGHARAA